MQPRFSITDKIDVFGQFLNLNIKPGREKFTTVIGSLCTLLIAGVIIAYGTFMTLQILALEPPPTKITTDIQFQDSNQNIFTVAEQNISNKDKRFNVAFGLSDQHDSSLLVEDKLYGSLQPMVTYRTQQGNFTYEYLDSQPCTQSMIAQDFFPAKSNSEAQEIAFHLPKMKCMKMHDKPMLMHGNFQTLLSEYLTIFYASCDLLNISKCKSEDQVTEWLKHKYILLYYTDASYNSTSNQTQPVSNFIMIPVNRLISTHHRFQLTETQITPQKSGYTIKQLADQTLVERLPYNDVVELHENRVAISFEVAPIVQVVIFTPPVPIAIDYQTPLINLAAQCGSFLFILYIIIAAFLSEIVKRQRDTQLISQLYKVAPPNGGEFQSQSYLAALREVDLREDISHANILQNIFGWFCGGKRFRYVMKQSRENLGSELNVKTIIDQNRMLKSAVRVLLSDQQIALCSQQLATTTIPHLIDKETPDQSSSEQLLPKQFVVKSDADRQLIQGLCNRRTQIQKLEQIIVFGGAMEEDNSQIEDLRRQMLQQQEDISQIEFLRSQMLKQKQEISQLQDSRELDELRKLVLQQKEEIFQYKDELTATLLNLNVKHPPTDQRSTQTSRVLVQKMNGLCYDIKPSETQCSSILTIQPRITDDVFAATTPTNQWMDIKIIQKAELLFEEVPESMNECQSELKNENTNDRHQNLKSQIKGSSFTVNSGHSSIQQINSDQSSNRPITRDVKYTSPIRDTISRGTATVNQEPPARSIVTPQSQSKWASKVTIDDFNRSQRNPIWQIISNQNMIPKTAGTNQSADSFEERHDLNSELTDVFSCQGNIALQDNPICVEARDEARTAPAVRRNVRLAIWDTYDYLKAKLNGSIDVTKSLESDRAILIKNKQKTMEKAVFRIQKNQALDQKSVISVPEDSAGKNRVRIANKLQK